MLWDVFCRVIDNHGDLGVCWRLSADLASRGERVRLWVDDARALAWMAPLGHERVTVLPWRDPEGGERAGDVVVEAFGCDPPAAFVALMAQARPAPAWINLEYLSAEAYVERSHTLPSPVLAGPGRGLTKRFFFPGFTKRTGGLLREPGLLERLDAVEPAATLAAWAPGLVPGSRTALLFCYRNDALAPWLDACSDGPGLNLLATPGHAQDQARAWLDRAPRTGPAARRPKGADEVGRSAGVSVFALPHVEQTRFDTLLRSCDLNFVRGEDSLVRAIWARRPFVWQAYPQADGAHAAKLEAFLDVLTQGLPADLAGRLRRIHRIWNGLAAGPLAAEIDAAWSTGWPQHAAHLATRLAAQPDLSSQLLAMAAAELRRNGPGS